MIRVYVICEGSTEEIFVNELLSTYMNSRGIFLFPSRIGKPGHKGGNVNIERLIFDLKQRLLKDKNCYCTTLIDYYGLPNNFPGKNAANNCNGAKAKLETISKALFAEIKENLGEASSRFIPYVQLHEFEGLLFSDPVLLAESLQQPSIIKDLSKIRDRSVSPEDINDDPNTAPSKRIERLFDAYDKPTHPILAAKHISLPKIRRECPLFDQWIKRLEGLAK